MNRAFEIKKMVYAIARCEPIGAYDERSAIVAYHLHDMLNYSQIAIALLDGKFSDDGWFEFQINKVILRVPYNPESLTHFGNKDA